MSLSPQYKSLSKEQKTAVDFAAGINAGNNHILRQNLQNAYALPDVLPEAIKIYEEQGSRIQHSL